MASKIGMQKKGSLSIVQFPLARWNSVFFHIIPIPSLPVIPPEVDGVWMVCFFLGPVIDSSRFTGVWKPIAGRFHGWIHACLKSLQNTGRNKLALATGLLEFSESTAPNSTRKHICPNLSATLHSTHNAQHIITQHSEP